MQVPSAEESVSVSINYFKLKYCPASVKMNFAAVTFNWPCCDLSVFSVLFYSNNFYDVLVIKL